VARILLVQQESDLSSLSTSHELWFCDDLRVVNGLCRWHKIDLTVLSLLLADGSSGPEFAAELLTGNPGLRILFVDRDKAPRIDVDTPVLPGLPQGRHHILRGAYDDCRLELEIQQLLAPNPSVPAQVPAIDSVDLTNLASSFATPFASAILAEIAEGSRLVDAAAKAYDKASKSAEALHLAAERTYYELLKHLCGLSDAVAEAVEPSFTRFESGLLRLPGGRRAMFRSATGSKWPQ